jgi:hypothetical protein
VEKVANRTLGIRVREQQLTRPLRPRPTVSLYTIVTRTEG